jgi:anti-sigma-K factor RskA
MSCEELRDHYELYALGVLEDPERMEIRQHLNRGCEACMAEVKRAREMIAVLGGSVAAAEPSPRLRKRILASVGVEQRRFWWTPLWAAAAAMCLLAAIYLGVRARQYNADLARLRSQAQEQTTELARLNEAFAILSGPGTAEASFGQENSTPPRGKVFVNRSSGVLLIASNLPPAPSGKIYEMWVIPRDGKPVPAGLFQSESGGTAMHLERGPVNPELIEAIAVTLEDEGGSNQPTSQPLIVAALGLRPGAQ